MFGVGCCFPARETTPSLCSRSDPVRSAFGVGPEGFRGGIASHSGLAASGRPVMCGFSQAGYSQKSALLHPILAKYTVFASTRALESLLSSHFFVWFF